MTDRPLLNRVALVTGGTGGIGTAICSRLHREGAKVIALDRDAPKSEMPEGMRYIPLDVTSEDSVKVMIADVEANENQVDILVNAAGIEIEKTIEDTSLEEWNLIFAVNVTGTFLVSKMVLPLMLPLISSKVNISDII